MQPEQPEKNKRLKVLFITKWYPDKFDIQFGVFIRKHAKAVALYCDVALLYITKDPGLQTRFVLFENENNGVKEFVFYFKPFQSKFRLVNRLINAARYFRTALRAEKIISKKWGTQDITHAYILTRPGIVAWYYRLRKNIPFIASEQWSGYATGAFQRKNYFENLITRWVVKRAKAVVTVSGFLKDHMQRNGIQGAFHIVPNTIDPGLFIDDNVKKNDSIRMLVVADLVDEIKNVSGVIRSFEKVSREIPNLQLTIAGDGRDRFLLESLAGTSGLLNSKIFFTGRLPNEKVYEAISSCSFLVMNSNIETFSLICAEALCCGKPVIATACGGPVDIINDAYGILIDPGNDIQLVEAIRKMVLEYRNFDPRTLRADAVRKFGPEITGKMYWEIYMKALV